MCLCLFLQILMYESSPVTQWEWVAAKHGEIPAQAVMFGNHDNNGAMFVAQIDGMRNVGSFASSGSCAEYYKGCTEQFSFLVLKHGESPVYCNYSLWFRAAIAIAKCCAHLIRQHNHGLFTIGFSGMIQYLLLFST